MAVGYLANSYQSFADVATIFKLLLAQGAFSCYTMCKYCLEMFLHARTLSAHFLILILKINQLSVLLLYALIKWTSKTFVHFLGTFLFNLQIKPVHALMQCCMHGDWESFVYTAGVWNASKSKTFAILWFQIAGVIVYYVSHSRIYFPVLVEGIIQWCHERIWAYIHMKHLHVYHCEIPMQVCEKQLCPSVPTVAVMSGSRGEVEHYNLVIVYREIFAWKNFVCKIFAEINFCGWW